MLTQAPRWPQRWALGEHGSCQLALSQQGRYHLGLHRPQRHCWAPHWTQRRLALGQLCCSALPRGIACRLHKSIIH